MELEELKNLWHSQDHQENFTINIHAMNDHIKLQNKKTSHLINVSELLVIGVNVLAGLFIILLNNSEPPSGTYLYVLGVWMLAVGMYALIFRIRRSLMDKRFDRSVRGDIDHAISTATYQVRLSQVMRWNIVPIAGLTLLALWGTDKSLWITGGVIVVFAVSFYFSRWEHNIYVNKRMALERIREKLLRGDFSA